MWSQYSDSQINIAEAVLMFSTVSWVAGHRVSGVVCFGPLRIRWKLSVLCDPARAFKFVLCRVELEPVPCVFYLHFNEAKGDLPFYCSQPLSLSPSLSFCLSASQTDIDLFARQGDPHCCSALPKSLLSLSFVPGKGFDPSHCCHIVAFCTWTFLH